MSRTAIVFAGGDEPGMIDLPPYEVAVAADSGLHVARAAGVDVDLVVGDLDSVDHALLAGLPTETYPADKDATDLELAVAAALRSGCDVLVVVGAEGGRFSHLLSAVGVLAAAAEQGVMVEWRMSGATVHFIAGTGRREREVSGQKGDLISLVPIGGDAIGVTASGVRWPLHAETVRFTESRGVSNELVGDSARVSVDSGVLAIVHERSEQ